MNAVEIEQASLRPGRAAVRRDGVPVRVPAGVGNREITLKRLRRGEANNPTSAACGHRDILHKIDVTSGDVARRIANARTDPTFLMADVETVAT